MFNLGEFSNWFWLDSAISQWGNVWATFSQSHSDLRSINLKSRLSVVTLAASLAGIVLSPRLGSWKYLLLFCTIAGFSCGAQAKMTLPMEIFGTKERSSIGPIMAFGWSTSGAGPLWLKNYEINLVTCINFERRRLTWKHVN